MLTRRKFIGASAATLAALSLPLVAGQSYEVGKRPWTTMSDAEQEKFRAWCLSHGIDPSLTYRVDVHRSHVVAYQYHKRGGRKHLACPASISPHDGVCRVQPYEVAL